MKIGGLQKITLIDYPGKPAAIIFTSGCSFCCPFCYNSELVLPEKIKHHPEILEKSIFNFLKERKGLLSGVVITGGEPTIYPDLPEFIKKVKNMGYLVKLDTNGTNPQMVEKLIKERLIDYIAMDIKAPLENEKYNKATGVKTNLNNIKKSIELIKNSGLDYEFRTTVVPTIHTKEDIIDIVQWVKPAKKYYLQNFRPEKTINPKFKKIKPYSEKYLSEIQKEISPFFKVCEIR